MKVEIKDTTKEINIALRSIGFGVNEESVEVILNVIDFVRENKNDTTLKEVIQVKERVKKLFKEETK